MDLNNLYCIYFLGNLIFEYTRASTVMFRKRKRWKKLKEYFFLLLWNLISEVEYNMYIFCFRFGLVNSLNDT